MSTIQLSLFEYFLDEPEFTVSEATDLCKNIKNMDVNTESIRARIYEGVERGVFEKVSRGVYKCKSQYKGQETTCLLINGNGRDLSMIEDESIDGIVTDHPYDLHKALSGGNRNFAKYELFQYVQSDFDEKSRILKKGAFLVEFLPEESEINYDYLYSVKEMAKKSGFKYYAKVPWVKGSFVANTGRKAKNSEDIMIFSKGEPRSLKLDAKKNYKTAEEYGLPIKNKTSEDVAKMLEKYNLKVSYMKGTNGMLPVSFDVQPKSKSEKIHSAEKPVELLEEIIEYISKPLETLLDQFGGSGNFAIACDKLGRNSIIIEKDEDTFKKMKENISKSIKSYGYER